MKNCIYTTITKTLETGYQRALHYGLFTARTYDALSSNLTKDLILLLTAMYCYASRNTQLNLHLHMYVVIDLSLSSTTP